MNHSSSAKSRRFKFGAAATVFTVLFVVAVIIFNIVASALAERFPLNLDLTPNATYSLSNEAENYIKNVKEKVEITVIGTEAQFANGSYAYREIPSTQPFEKYFASISQILNEIPKINPLISVSYKDKTADPSYFQQFTEDLSNGMIVVKSEKRHRLLTYYDYLTIVDDVNNSQYSTYLQMGYYIKRVTGSNLENAVCSSLINVTAESLPVVTMLTGHNEETLDAYTNMLTSNGYELKSCNIVTGDIEEATEFLVIAGPQRDYSEDDLTKLDRYLEKGKNLMVFLDPSVGGLDNLEAFLAEWGISVGKEMIVESDNANVYHDISYVVSYYNDTDYTAGLNAPAVLPKSRPLNVLWEEKNGITVKSIVKTSDTAVLYPVDAGVSWTVDQGQKGSYNGITRSTKLVSSSEQGRVYSNVFVCGSMYFVYDNKNPNNFLSNPSFGNAELALNIVNKSTDTDAEKLNLITKVIDPQELQNMTLKDANAYGVVFMAVIPILMLLAGLGVWIWRKRL